MATLEAVYKEMKARKVPPEAWAMVETRFRSTVETEMQTIAENRDNRRLFVEACALGMKHVVLRMAAEKAVSLAAVAVEGVLAAVATGQADLLQSTLYPLPAVHAQFTRNEGDAARASLHTAFVAAAKAGDVATVQALVACSGMHLGDVPALNPAGNENEALRVAAEAGRDKVVAHLLTLPAEAGVRVTDRDHDVLRVACKKRRRSVIKQLLKAPGVKAGLDHNLPLLTACETGDVATVRDLLSMPDVDPGADNDEALCRAAEKGKVAVVTALIGDTRVNPGARDNFPFRVAAKGGHVKVIRALLQCVMPNVDPTAPNGECEAFHTARVLGHDEVALVLAQDSRVAAALGLPVQPQMPAAVADPTTTV